MSLLLELFGQLNEEMVASADALEAQSKLKQELDFEDENFINISSKTFKVLVPAVQRYSTVERINRINGFERDRNMKGSSMGGFHYKTANVLIKPSEVQGRGAPGLDNEDIFVEHINEFASTDHPITVKFGKVIIKDVVKAIPTGTQTKEYKKTDAVLAQRGGSSYKVSIKKDNADFWESADKRYKELMKELIDEIRSDKHSRVKLEPVEGKKDIYKMYDKKTGKPIAALIKKIEDISEVNDIVFGTDEVNAVIVRTFDSSDFTYNDETRTLDIGVSEVIRNLDDLKRYDKWPVLRIRHDITRDATYGLRPIIYTERAAYTRGAIELE